MSSNDSPQSQGYLKREQLIGKSVITSNAQIIGSVKDIAVTTDGKIGLHVLKSSETGSGEVIINADEIQAMGDVVLLKPIATRGSKMPDQSSRPMPPTFPSATMTRTCGRCGYVNGANSRFCIKCGMSLQ
jgi:sporulation protein YlmC with PRC-barrel domain